MDTTIATLLAVDGIVNGAVYSLMAISIILIFSVTRVLFIPLGEFIVFGAATLAQLQLGVVPSSVWLLLSAALCCGVQELWNGWRNRDALRKVSLAVVRVSAAPVAVAATAAWLSDKHLPLAFQVLVTLALVAPLGGLIYRLIYRSLSQSTVLTLLIVSVGVHFGLTSLALAFLGPEGFRTPAFAAGNLSWGPVSFNGQSAVIFAASAILISVLFILFTRTFRGMALRATAVNQLGARLVGLSAERAGALSFTLAAALGAFSGVLIAPNTTIFYDTGFLIGLKGFVAAVFAGIASFPGALVGAILVGLLESYGSFWASAFKETIVFTAVLPILLWRSILRGSDEEH